MNFSISINEITSRDRTLSKADANSMAAFGWYSDTYEWTRSVVGKTFQKEWMSGLSTDGRKRKESIQGVGVLFLDIDDPTKHGAELLEVVHQRLSNAGYAHAIATSANHMKEKIKASGEVLPACPRLKIMIPLDVPYLFVGSETEQEQKRENWKAGAKRITAYFERLLECELDHSSLDANRYSYRINPQADNFQFRFSDGNGFDAKRYCYPAPINLIAEARRKKLAERFNTDDNMDRVKDAARYFFSEHRGRDEWVNVCFAVANLFGIYELKAMTELTSGEESSFKRQTSGRTVGAGTIIHLAKQYGWEYKK
ncbi:hypothetical protein ACET7H_17510 [Aeromonas veronii]